MAQPSVPMKVLRAFLSRGPGARMHCTELSRATGHLPGSVHPALQRLVALGWVTRYDEPGDPAELGRPRYVYYELTELGYTGASELIQAMNKIRVEIHAVLEVDLGEWRKIDPENLHPDHDPDSTDPEDVRFEVRDLFPIKDRIPCWAENAITLIEER